MVFRLQLPRALVQRTVAEIGRNAADLSEIDRSLLSYNIIAFYDSIIHIFCYSHCVFVVRIQF